METEALGGFGLGVEVVAAGSMAVGGGGLLIHMTSPCTSSLEPHPSVGLECGSRSEPGHGGSCGHGCTCCIHRMCGGKVNDGPPSLSFLRLRYSEWLLLNSTPKNGFSRVVALAWKNDSVCYLDICTPCLVLYAPTQEQTQAGAPVPTMQEDTPPPSDPVQAMLPSAPKHAIFKIPTIALCSRHITTLRSTLGASTFFDLDRGRVCNGVGRGRWAGLAHVGMGGWLDRSWVPPPPSLIQTELAPTVEEEAGVMLVLIALSLLRYVVWDCSLFESLNMTTFISWYRTIVISW
jgi:hypothetical protein